MQQGAVSSVALVASDQDPVVDLSRADITGKYLIGENVQCVVHYQHLRRLPSQYIQVLYVYIVRLGAGVAVKSVAHVFPLGVENGHDLIGVLLLRGR